jgi:CheY-like chemotaxis protein
MGWELPPGSSTTGTENIQASNTSFWSTISTPHPQAYFRILLVEDNDINLKLLVQYMTRAVQPYAAATNGAEVVAAYKAVAASNDSRFTAILMDIQMPIQDGLSATREIRQFEHEHSLPRSTIIALTASDSLDLRRDAFVLGIDQFLTKPVQMKELKRFVIKLREGNG